MGRAGLPLWQPNQVGLSRQAAVADVSSSIGLVPVELLDV
jgi:hypothetical protein